MSALVSHIVSLLSVPRPVGYTSKQRLLVNPDLKPVERARRKWGPWNFVGLWVADSINITTWIICSTMIQSGLSWWQAWLAVWFGYGVVAIGVVLNGRAAAVWHIGLPVHVRSSFGVWGGLWPVLNRTVMACIWYGVQTWLGGQCLTLAIRSIWPSYAHLHNSMPASSGTNTRDFLSFFLFWLFSLPAIWPPVEKLRHLFTVKSIVVPIAGIAFFAWSIADAHGIGPIIHQPASIHGSDLGWTFMVSVSACISNWITLVVNTPDFTRFSRKPNDPILSQIIGIPVLFGMTAFFGIIVASSATVLYGETLWNPLDILGRRLDLDPYGSKTRAGVFFISLAFALATLGTNITANSISAGSDLTAIFPRFITIRRGGYVAAIVGLCMCPWNLLSSSNNFTTYLNAYSVFLSSIAGVMVADYYIVRRGFLDVPSLYSLSSNRPYFFTYGFNLRAFAAYIAGILVNVVGFAGAVGRTVPIAATHIYTLAFFTGFGVSFLCYWLICLVFPPPGRLTSGWHEDLHWEPEELGDSEHRLSLGVGNTGSELDPPPSFKNKEDVEAACAHVKPVDEEKGSQ